jgi:hypothetical protein
MINKAIKRAMKFKGKNKKNKYFEGWYYKFVTKDKRDTIAFIPGISLQKKNPHAFIQVIHQHLDDIKTKYISYDLNEFSYDQSHFTLKIGESKFSLKSAVINIESDGLSVVADIEINHLTAIQTSKLSPSIMGFFDFFPFMECNHDVVSMNHDLRGYIYWNKIKYDFNGGKGYIEKDFGKSFPESYVWIQSNHFQKTKDAFMFSYAKIPFLGFKFNGLIANLIVANEEYRFATYNRSKIKVLTQKDNHFKAEVKKGKFKLLIDARNKGVVALASPKDGEMNHQIKEGLSGQVHLMLYYKDHLLFDDTGRRAGVEIML